MNAALARLTPGERRFVVAVALILFLVINIFWVWPHFSDFSDLRSRAQAADLKLASYQGVIQQVERLKAELSRLEGEGASVPPDDQSVEFFRTVQAQAMKCGVQFIGNSRTTTRTNQFFLEQIQTITVQATEKELVDFLFNLGSGDSLIRARSLAVHPDSSRQQLNATITLIASYQNNPKAPSATATPAPRVAAAPPVPRAVLTNKPAIPGGAAPALTGSQKKK